MKFSSLTRIYTKAKLLTQEILSLNDDEHLHYIKNVLRLNTGSKIRLFNEIDGEYEAIITSFSKHDVVFKIEKLLRKPLITTPITLGLCIIKSDRMLDAIDMAAQVGVSKITPIISDYSQKNFNMDKAERRMVQAIQQSERLTPVVIAPPTPLSSFIENSNYIVFANESEDTKNSLLSLSLSSMQGIVSLLVGPEGGFSATEKEMLSSSKNTMSFSLGNEVLRTETATVAGLAQLKLLLTRV
jgi:16S rRNA (uracil1498-N3)-methyltransferase